MNVVGAETSEGCQSRILHITNTLYLYLLHDEKTMPVDRLFYNISLFTFYYQAKYLLKKNYKDFIQFVLVGKYNNCQAIGNTIIDSISNEKTFNAFKDYKSVFDIDKDIMIQNALMIYLLQKEKIQARY